MMKPYYRTLVMGGWSKSACCDLVPLRLHENAFYCQCSNAKLISDQNDFKDDFPSSIVIPEVKLVLNPKVEKTTPFSKPAKENADLPW